MDDPPINLVRHIRGHTADHIRPTVENGEDAGGTPPSVLDLLKGEAKGWYDTTASTLKTDAVADFTAANSEHLSITDAAQSGLDLGGDWSMSAWVYLNSATSGRIINKYAGGSDRSYEVLFDGTYINVNLSNTGTSGTMILVSNTAAPIGSWFHIGVTSVVNGVRALYQNGVVVYTFNYSTIGALYNNAIPFRLGAYSTPSIFLDGRMSCVSIWNNRTLSTPDIVAIYNSGTPREYADLTTAEKVDMVSFWHLNEPSGTRYDAHGSNDLTDNNTVGVTTGPVEYTATENAAITKWENQAGNASPYSNGTRAAASNSPYVSGGLPRFTGAPGLTVTGATLTQPNVIWAVVTNNSTGIYRRIVGWFNTTGADPSQLLYVTVPSTTARIYAGAAAVGNTATTLGVRHSQAAEFNSTSSKMYLDGAVDKTTNAGTNSAGNLVIGNDDDANPTYGWLGTIELVLLLDRALTSQEIAALNTL